MSDATGSPYYGPIGETSSDIMLEKTFLASGYLTGVGFGTQFEFPKNAAEIDPSLSVGVQLVLYCMCTLALWRRNPRTRSTYLLLGYIFILNAMNAIWTGTSAYGLQLTFIDNRNYPGGPLGFLGVEFSISANVLSLASLIAGNLLADGLLVCVANTLLVFQILINPNHMCPAMALLCYLDRVVGGPGNRSDGRTMSNVNSIPWYAVNLTAQTSPLTIVLPTVMSCFFAMQTVSPAGFFSQSTVNFGLTYFAISLSLNILLTIMIIVRMWAQKVKSRAIFGEEYGQHYTSVSTMFVESAALYCLFSILLLITYAMNHPINQIWLGISPAVQVRLFVEHFSGVELILCCRCCPAISLSIASLKVAPGQPIRGTRRTRRHPTSRTLMVNPILKLPTRRLMGHISSTHSRAKTQKMP